MTSAASRIGSLLLIPLLMLIASPPLAGVQAASPTPGDGVFIYRLAISGGTCDQPVANPAYELGVVDADLFPGPADPEREPVVQEVPPLALSVTIDVPLDALVSGRYVLLAVGGVTSGREIVACRQIEGPIEDGKLVLDLAPVDDSLVSGNAVLRALDGRTQVDIVLYRDVAYVTSVPVDLQPGVIALFRAPPPGPTTFVVFNQGVEGEATFAVAGPGIAGVRAISVDVGRLGYLSAVLQPGTYQLSCPECGEAGQPAVRQLVVRELPVATPASPEAGVIAIPTGESAAAGPRSISMPSPSFSTGVLRGSPALTGMLTNR